MPKEARQRDRRSGRFAPQASPRDPPKLEKMKPEENSVAPKAPASATSNTRFPALTAFVQHILASEHLPLGIESALAGLSHAQMSGVQQELAQLHTAAPEAMSHDDSVGRALPDADDNSVIQSDSDLTSSPPSPINNVGLLPIAASVEGRDCKESVTCDLGAAANKIVDIMREPDHNCINSILSTWKNPPGTLTCQSTWAEQVVGHLSWRTMTSTPPSASRRLRLKGDDLLPFDPSYNHLIIPLQLIGGDHWTLALIDKSTKSVHLFDNMSFFFHAKEYIMRILAGSPETFGSIDEWRFWDVNMQQSTDHASSGLYLLRNIEIVHSSTSGTPKFYVYQSPAELRMRYLNMLIQKMPEEMILLDDWKSTINNLWRMSFTCVGNRSKYL